MDTNNQYELTLNNGEKNEEGFFFRAAPFTVESQAGTYAVDFVPTPHHEVVYQVSLNGEVIAEYEHPFFIPDEEPEQALSEFSKKGIDALPLFHALVELNISKQKDYRKFLADQKLTYKVSQPIFLG